MTKILFLGDTAGTGFGTVTRDLASALLRQGDDVRLVSMNEDASYQSDPGFPKDLLDKMVMLGHDDGWLALRVMDKTGEAARQRILTKARGLFTGKTILNWVPDVCLMVSDMASLKESPWPGFVPDGMRILHYCPVEGVDLPPRWALLWARLEPVAMCEFGADEIEKVTRDRPPVVYHGVDPEHFHPVSGKRPLVFAGKNGVMTVLRSRGECKDFLGWPRNETILFRADRHVPRKNYPALFREVAPVLAAHPDVRLVWHCRTVDQGGDLLDERSKYPPDIGIRMNSTGMHDQYGGVDRKVLCAMYNAADLLVTSSAEGFGLTIAEALACGTPAVGLDYSAVPEVIGPAGKVVPVFLQDNIYSHFWAAPRPGAMTDAIEYMVSHPKERREMGMLGPAWVKRFDWDEAAARFSALAAGRPVPAYSGGPTEATGRPLARRAVAVHPEALEASLVASVA